MQNSREYFIAVYTNQCKDYCDELFFNNLKQLAKEATICIVDNSNDNGKYFVRIRELMGHTPNVIYHHVVIPQEPKRTQFLRNVCESVNKCREEFLKTMCTKFLVIESDVIPPVDLLDKFDATINFLNIFYPREDMDWGAIGGTYYEGWHDFANKKGVCPTHHLLSGCTLYKRDCIKEIPFRWELDNINAFPDAYMSVDIQVYGYALYDDYNIKCEHLCMESGARQSKSI